jgi:hypothetical protein
VAERKCDIALNQRRRSWESCCVKKRSRSIVGGGPRHLLQSCEFLSRAKKATQLHLCGASSWPRGETGGEKDLITLTTDRPSQGVATNAAGTCSKSIAIAGQQYVQLGESIEGFVLYARGRNER